MPKPPDGHSLADQLREVIGSRPMSVAALARDSGVDAAAIGRFLRHERTITLETAGRLAAALGVRLIEVGRRGRARPARRDPVLDASPVSE
jgi:transcriptional regulator with XRE-family HTH domain